MLFHHRQTDTDIVQHKRDVYITSRAKNHSPRKLNFTNFPVHIAQGAVARSSFGAWRYDMLCACTSGFLGDVMLLHNIYAVRIEH